MRWGRCFHSSPMKACVVWLLWTTDSSSYCKISQRLNRSRCWTGRMANTGSSGWNNTGLFSLWDLRWLADALARCFPVKSRLRSLSSGSIVYSASSVSTVGVFHKPRVLCRDFLCVHEYVTLMICMRRENRISACVVGQSVTPVQEELLLFWHFLRKLGFMRKSFKGDNL